MEIEDSAGGGSEAAWLTMGSETRVDFSLETPYHGGALVLRCQGKLVFQGEARTLCTLVAELLPSARRMVVDLSEVECIDSAGLGELVLAQMWAEAAGFELKFADPRTSVRQLFELTNLVSVFDLYSSVPEAIAAIHPGELPLV